MKSIAAPAIRSLEIMRPQKNGKERPSGPPPDRIIQMC
jgi:hypothetical protein